MRPALISPDACRGPRAQPPSFCHSAERLSTVQMEAGENRGAAVYGAGPGGFLDPRNCWKNAVRGPRGGRPQAPHSEPAGASPSFTRIQSDGLRVSRKNQIGGRRRRVRPTTREATNRTRKMTNRMWATLAETAATPPNPRRPATSAITRKTAAQYNMMFPFAFRLPAIGETRFASLPILNVQNWSKFCLARVAKSGPRPTFRVFRLDRRNAQIRESVRP